MRYQFPIFFRPPGAPKPRQDCRTQPASTEVARIPDRIQLHPGIPQRPCQWKRRFSLPRAFACDGARPQRSQQPYSVRRRTRLPQPRARPTSSWTPHRARRFWWVNASRPELWLGWAHALPRRFSIFSLTRAPNEGWRPRCSIRTICCPCSASHRVGRGQLGFPCQRMRQRFPCRFRLHRPS